MAPGILMDNFVALFPCLCHVPTSESFPNKLLALVLRFDSGVTFLRYKSKVNPNFYKISLTI